MVSFKINKFGQRVGTRDEGKVAQPEIEAVINRLPYGEILILDFEGIDLLGYSFADQAIAITLHRLVSNEYGDKYILIKCHKIDILESLEVALEKRQITAIAIDDGGKWFCVGLKKENLMETLDIIIERKEITTSDLADIMKLTVTNCNNRVSELAAMKLIKREKVNNPSGGILYMNKSIV
jgi:hypothetical protein